MAKSKNGGTRSMIRGRVGSDVYSVGKDGKGQRQQVIRSLAEEVANPRTEAQMFGRMIMSSVMQAVSALQPIIDHSFDGFPKGQPSISEFIRRNYALIKADAEAHPATGNKFGLVKYQEKGVHQGMYVVSNGNLQVPAAVVVAANELSIMLTADTLTVGGLKAALGLSADGYLTYVGIATPGGLRTFRVYISTTLSDDTAITDANVASLFTIEGNVTVTTSLSTNTITFGYAEDSNVDSEGAILSDKVNGAWAHSSCTLSEPATVFYSANNALPTYPVGTEQFLNGGDL